MRIFIIFCLLFIIMFMIVKKKDTDISTADIFSNHSLQEKVKERMERAYAHGQRDAIDGKIRIQHVDSNCYVFTKSPWLQNVGVVRETLWLSE